MHSTGDISGFPFVATLVKYVILFNLEKKFYCAIYLVVLFGYCMVIQRIFRQL